MSAKRVGRIRETLNVQFDLHLQFSRNGSTLYIFFTPSWRARWAIWSLGLVTLKTPRFQALVPIDILPSRVRPSSPLPDISINPFLSVYGIAVAIPQSMNIPCPFLSSTLTWKNDMSDLLDKFTTAELASLFIGPSLVLGISLRCSLSCFWALKFIWCPVFCQTVETGVIIGQFITFWSNISSAHETFDVQNKIRNNGSLTSSTRLPKERGLMMMVSIYVLVITLVQTSFAISDGFSNLVDSFGKLVCGYSL